MESSGVIIWWVSLSLIGVLNIALWTWSARKHGHDQTRKWQLLLSAGYVFGCAFRSFLPRADVQRIVLFDSWLSSVFVGRTVATIAELCFVAQLALTIFDLAKETDHKGLQKFAQVFFPMMVVAETCSWYAVLTTNYLGNTMEESLWATLGIFLLISLVILSFQYKNNMKRFLLALTVPAIGYVTFMCTVDVPMYFNRWRADIASGKPYLSIMQGLIDLNTRWHVTFSMDEWRTEIPWMTLYFSFAVWISIGLVYLPELKKAVLKK